MSKKEKKIRKISIKEEVLIDQIIAYLWNSVTVEQLFKISNMLLKTNYNTTKHRLSDRM